MSASDVKKELQKYANPKQAKLLQGYFKTGKGQYGEGDIFLGLKVPQQRKVAAKFDLSLVEIGKLLNSKIHEHRLVALFILIKKYQKTDEKKKIFDFYLKHTKYVNNWDLVDLSAPKIVGDYLLDKSRSILYKLAKSKNLWERRISALATAAFIDNNDFDDALKIAEILLSDKHDLIHKAVGWMLREVGKRNRKTLEMFLNKYCRKMPRTMLRYSIERLDKKKKEFYMKI
jgi:3-methyladenine DNA glycosylase AlkD